MVRWKLLHVKLLLRYKKAFSGTCEQGWLRHADGGKKRQLSYTVAFKLEVIAWYRKNGDNKHEMSRHFGIDRKRV